MRSKEKNLFSSERKGDVKKAEIDNGFELGKIMGSSPIFPGLG